LTVAKLPGNYWRQLGATAVSNIGDGMVTAAAPLLTLSLTNDTRLIAGVSFASTLPWLVLSLPAGVYIDRFERKHLMVIVNIIRAVLFGVIAVAAATQNLNIWMFMGILVGVGACEVIFDMSAQAFLPSIVPEELLEKANGRLYSIEMICNSFLGLPLGAWLFVLAVGVPFGVNAVAVAVAAALVASIRLPIVEGAGAVGGAAAPVKSFRKDLREGMQWLWASELVRTLAIMLGIVNMASMFGSAIFVKYAADELGVTGRGFGLLLSVMAVGSIVGGLIGDRIAKRLGVAWAIILAYAIFGLGGIVYVVLPRVWAIVIAVAVLGVAGTTWNIVTVSLRQRIIPTELFGRVNSVYRFVGTGSMAIGALAGGFIAYRYGLRAPYLASTIVSLAGLVWGAPILLRQLRV